jgi:hypothetical protein
MNRIRKINNHYQVFITPNSYALPSSNIDFTLTLLDNWYDTEFTDYHIIEFDNLQDAQFEAFKYPNIDWYKIVLFHKNIYDSLIININKIIFNHKLIVEFNSQLLSEEQLKNKIFEKLSTCNHTKSLSTEPNTVFGFSICNPWTSNLEKISKILTQNRELNIIGKTINKGVIYLIGKTPLGTTYEIILWPTMLYYLTKWKTINNGKYSNMENIYSNKCNNITELQKIIDSYVVEQ